MTHRPTRFATRVLRLWTIGGTVLVLILLASSIRPDRESLALMFAMVIMLALLLLSGIANFRADRRQRWADHRRCTECGYDLRATPYRCPECGITTGRWNSRMRQRLRQALPQQPMTPVVLADGEPVAVVYASVNGIEVDLLRQHLQARGIACRAEKRLGPLGRSALHAPEVYGLMVAAHELERATRLIEHLLVGEQDEAGRLHG